MGPCESSAEKEVDRQSCTIREHLKIVTGNEFFSSGVSVAEVQFNRTGRYRCSLILFLTIFGEGRSGIE